MNQEGNPGSIAAGYLLLADRNLMARSTVKSLVPKSFSASSPVASLTRYDANDIRPICDGVTSPPPTSQPATVETPQPLAAGGGRTIEIEHGRDTTIITIEGELILGDEKHFADAAVGVNEAFVVLSNPGDNLFAGSEIGKAMRLKGFSTVVPEGFQCASACAWAWLAGSPRFMGKGATIGFHAAYLTENGENTVSSSGNALVGAYLNQLGLPFPAIAYITEAQPNDIHWLTFDEAEPNGIDVRMFPSG